jgi:hypothetical protein
MLSKFIDKAMKDSKNPMDQDTKDLKSNLIEHYKLIAVKNLYETN